MTMRYASWSMAVCLFSFLPSDAIRSRPVADRPTRGLRLEVIDLTDVQQTPDDTHRESFTYVLMPRVLRERRKVINCLEDNQVEEGIKQLAGEYRVRPLLESVEPN